MHKRFNFDTIEQVKDANPTNPVWLSGVGVLLPGGFFVVAVSHGVFCTYRVANADGEIEKVGKKHYGTHKEALVWIMAMQDVMSGVS